MRGAQSAEFGYDLTVTLAQRAATWSSFRTALTEGVLRGAAVSLHRNPAIFFLRLGKCRMAASNENNWSQKRDA
jgi:hypothetical protein